MHEQRGAKVKGDTALYHFTRSNTLEPSSAESRTSLAASRFGWTRVRAPAW